MKKIFYSFVLLAVATLSVYAQPEIRFERMVHDYGQVAQGANGDTEFKFRNTGTEPLILFNVQTSCGCVTAPSWPREPIMPGQEGVIRINYNTQTTGPMGKAITVFSNAKTDRVTLRLAGNVNPR